MLLRARLVLPVARPPIEDGAVWIAGDRLAFVGPWSEVPPAARTHGAGEDHGRMMDLGDVVLLPGLINAHCHLDYTRMAGLIPPPRDFVSWIKSIVALKGTWSAEEFADSWQAGAAMLVRHGTTTVADMEAIPELVPDLWPTTPLRVISYRELIGFKDPTRAEELVRTTVAAWSGCPDAGRRLGLAPHAPYSTCPELLRAAARAARQHGWPLAIHVAESEPEYEMFVCGHGPLHAWLKDQRDMSDCGLGSPVQHLDRCGCLGSDLLAVHANYLWQEDPRLLAQRGVSVVHCPRSHAYFGHRRFPRESLTQASVNICLGTDSLATVIPEPRRAAELSLFAEMHALAAQARAPAPETILQMATVNGARALGRPAELGELSAGALADLIAIPFSGPTANALEAVVHHTGPVTASMIAGQWALTPSGA